MFTENNAKEALQKFALKDKERAMLLEKIIRIDTNHFKTLKYKFTGSSGLEVSFWKKYIFKYFSNGYEVIGISGKNRINYYVVFSDVYNFLEFLSDYIDRKNGKYLDWFTLDEIKQKEFDKTLNRIINRFVI